MVTFKSSLLWIGAIAIWVLLSAPGMTIAGVPTLSYNGSTTGIGKGTLFVPETELSLTGGYRTDDLDWNIAGDINLCRIA